MVTHKMGGGKATFLAKISLQNEHRKIRSLISTATVIVTYFGMTSRLSVLIFLSELLKTSSQSLLFSHIYLHRIDQIDYRRHY